jgi:hypothetical protein
MNSEVRSHKTGYEDKYGNENKLPNKEISIKISNGQRNDKDH